MPKAPVTPLARRGRSANGCLNLSRGVELGHLLIVSIYDLTNQLVMLKKMLNLKDNYNCQLRGNKASILTFIISKTVLNRQKMNSKFTNFNYSNEWAKDNTLGGKAKEFYWKMDDTNSLHISRLFKNKEDLRQHDVEFSAPQLDLIMAYVEEAEIVRLGNSVSKLTDGSEKEGLGRFILESLNLPLTTAQASSQIATLFVQAAIWQLERKGGMQFKANKVSWKELLRNYYNRGTNTVIN
ncbi:hypothetical protein [Fibrella arboris]|uniref:hypothetical protein n=1 Tax=Fibrella arboris TaxID=3242486 RepID=UPI00351FF718